MPQKNNPKRHEHFVPEFYLKHFSPDNVQIYQYKIKSKEPSKLVPIKSICYRKDLYEFKNNDNNFVFRNLIENAFEKLEGEFSNVIKSIVYKSQYERNYSIPCFLKTEEKYFLIMFVATSILRTPNMLKIATESVLDLAQKYGKTISSNTARNSAILSCLPLVDGIEKDSGTVFNFLIDRLIDMSFIIGVANGDRFFTSDEPVFWQGNNTTFEINEVVFPLTPSIVLFLYPAHLLPEGFRNRLIRLKEKNVKDVNYRIKLFCREWLYCKKELKNNQIMAVEKIKEGQNATF